MEVLPSIEEDFVTEPIILVSTYEDNCVFVSSDPDPLVLLRLRADSGKDLEPFKFFDFKAFLISLSIPLYISPTFERYTPATRM